MAETAQAAADQPKNRPSKSAVLKLAREIDAKRQTLDDVAMSHADLHKKIDEKLNLNSAAFKLALKLRRMDPSKRDVFLADLDFLRDMFDLDAQPNLFEDAQDGKVTATEASLGQQQEELDPDGEKAAADRAGEAAGLAGEPYASCPHNANDALRAFWQHGHKRGTAARAEKIRTGTDDEADETKLAVVYEEGADAAREGKPRTDNPYDSGTPEQQRWDLGFANTSNLTKPNSADNRSRGRGAVLKNKSGRRQAAHAT